MLVAVKLLVAGTALGEVWFFGRFTDLPTDPMGVLAILAGVAWLMSPLVALVLAATDNRLQNPQRVTLLTSSILCTTVAIWLFGPWAGPSPESGGGLVVFVVPALQWVFVIAGLVTLGVHNRRQRANTART